MCFTHIRYLSNSHSEDIVHSQRSHAIAFDFSLIHSLQGYKLCMEVDFRYEYMLGYGNQFGDVKVLIRMRNICNF